MEQRKGRLVSFFCHRDGGGKFPWDSPLVWVFVFWANREKEIDFGEKMEKRQ